MTLAATGLIGFANVVTEIGAASGAAMSLGWIKTNSYYQYKDLGSIHGLTWFKAVSSKNSVTRTTAATTTNCANAVTTVQTNTKNFKGSGSSHFGGTYIGSTAGLTNCNARVVQNCDQCAYDHGTYLQKNCNCNCNCAACNCDYKACNCPVVNCSTCSSTCSSTCGTCSTCACTCTCTCTCLGTGTSTCNCG